MKSNEAIIPKLCTNLSVFFYKDSSVVLKMGYSDQEDELLEIGKVVIGLEQAKQLKDALAAGIEELLKETKS